MIMAEQQVTRNVNELLFNLPKIIKILLNVVYYDERNCIGPV